ncbi:hypothetical protein ACH5RR_030998 [Cinchona calisaya]|uniref:Uncharacterized protein n=1 Tax=Cinchona calisaya TaxID=153742 RepID=A0ABD2YFY0_9GENT
MKTVLVLFVALVLILGSFEANAKRLLLSDAVGRKVLSGPSDSKPAQTTDQATNKANNNNGAAGAVDKNNNDVFDQDSGPDTHRYFPCEQLQTIHCR